MVQENITEPLNNKERLYYSLLFDGSSNAKTNDEKELYVIKTCDGGRPRFDVFALEEPNDGDANGLKAVLDHVFDKGNFQFERSEREIGLGSDGTSTNKNVHRLEKADVGDHLILILCLSHKLELAIHDAFRKESCLNEDAEEQLISTYYLFKRANLKWRLFKRHAVMIGLKHRRYKRPGGTRWVAHQVEALDTFFVNLPILIDYLQNQIADPHNATMKKEVPRLEGILSDCSNLKILLFNVIKVDTLRVIKPASLVLESASVLLPEAITTISITVTKIKKLRSKFISDGVDLFKEVTFFPTFNNEFLPHSEFDQDGHSIGRSTRREPARIGVTTYAGYTLQNVNLEDALSEIYNDLIDVLEALEEAIITRFSFLTDDPLISSASVLLDSSAYKRRDEEDIKKACNVIVSHFRTPLEANDFIVQRLREFDYVFLSLFSLTSYKSLT